jgi:hypothetical protein
MQQIQTLTVNHLADIMVANHLDLSWLMNHQKVTGLECKIKNYSSELVKMRLVLEF